MPIIIKFIYGPYRKNIKKTPKPIKRSEYTQELWKIGAGWSDE